MNASTQVAKASQHDDGDFRDILQSMEHQRLRAITAFWTTLFKTIVLIPLCFVPGLLFLTSGDGIVLLDIVNWAESQFNFTEEVSENVGIAVVVAGAVWFFGGLILLGRYFTRAGRQPGWTYIHDYKTNVFAKVCKQRFADLTYLPGKGMPWKVLDESRLYPWISDDYSSDDFFQGSVGATDISFAEATAKRERRRYTGDGNRTYLDTYFRGIIFVADFHKHFHSTTRIIPAQEKTKRVRGQEKIVFEDPEFQEMFTTTSTDQVDARYILSTSMLRRLLKVAKRFKGLRVQFHQEQMIMLLPSRRDRFEPKLRKKADNLAQVNDFVRDVETILPVVDELNLNTRIWSKT